MRLIGPAQTGLALALALGLALAAMGAAAAPSLRVGLATFTETQAIRTDGVPAPGEQGTLRITLTNEGSVVESGITGRLTVLGPSGASVVADSTSWPDLPSRACAADLGALTVALDGAMPCGGALELMLDVTTQDGSVTLPIRLAIGSGDASSSAPTPVSTEATDRTALAWNGTELGLAWVSDTFTSLHFQRFDASGMPVGPRHDLGWGATVLFRMLAYGGGRWALPRIEAGRLYLWLLDGSGTPTEIDLGPLPPPPNLGPAIAWDGTGWSIVVYNRIGTRPVHTDVHFFHASPDGTPDAGPVIWSPGGELAYGPRMIWNGDELMLLLLYPDQTARIAFLSRAGEVLHVSEPAAHGLSNPTMAWNGRTLALGGYDGSVPRAMILDRCGQPLTGSVPLDVQERPNYGSGSNQLVDQVGSVTAEDGGVFGLTVAQRLTPDGFGALDQWAMLYRFDESARPVSPPRRITPDDAEGWRPAYGLAWRPDTQEYVVPVIHHPDWITLLGGDGSLDLVRAPVAARCPAGEPPREVSPAGSSIPLLARKELWQPCGICEVFADVVLSVEDLGAEATAYNAVMVYPSWFDPSAGFQPYWVSCHHREGGDPPATRVPGGRIELTLRADRSIVDSNFGQTNLEFYRVSASNPWGEGPLGTDSQGNQSTTVQGCLDDTP